MSLTVEEIEQITIALSEPFDPDDVSFLPQAVDYRNKTAVAAAYADPRVYFERLDKVVGPSNWNTDLAFLTTPYTKIKYGKKGMDGEATEPDKITNGHKVICHARVWISELGTKSSSGEKDASDENAATSAEAQAVKRAISQFGPGKYFYSLGKTSYAYDTKKKVFTVTPQLPDRAIKVACEDCSTLITSTTYTKQDHPQTLSVAEVISHGRNKYGKRLCAECLRKRAAATKDIIDSVAQRA